jgi:hypothetical protein
LNQYVFKGSTITDSFMINEIDIFKENWIDTGKEVEVIDPIYNVKKKFPVWSIISDNKEITFVSGELSNGVFGIWQ